MMRLGVSLFFSFLLLSRETETKSCLAPYFLSSPLFILLGDSLENYLKKKEDSRELRLNGKMFLLYHLSDMAIEEDIFKYHENKQKIVEGE